MLAATAAISVVLLCLTWLLLLSGALRHTLRVRTAVTAALAWATPFAVGPPLFSRDVYAYAAQGELARRGLDPATHGVSELASRTAGGEAFVHAVDPRWHETHAPYGGLAVAVEKLAAAVGDLLGTGPTGATVTLRVVAVISTVALVPLTLRLWRGPGPVPCRTDAHTAIVLALLAANPVLIMHLIGGSHLDALAAALLVAALVVDRRRGRPRDGAGGRDQAGAGGRDLAFGTAAVALACLAGSVKATAFLGVGWLVFAHVRDAWHSDAHTHTPAADADADADGHLDGRGPARDRVRVLARTLGVDVGAAAAALVAAMVVGGFGPTWIGALATSGKLETGVAPASMLATVLSAPASLVGLDDADTTLLGITRALALATAGLTVLWLALRSWSRPGASGYRDDLVVVGYGGLAVALGSPVLYPWYLALSVPFLAVLVALDQQGENPAWRRVRLPVGLIVVTSVWLCVSTLSPLAATWRLFG